MAPIAWRMKTISRESLSLLISKYKTQRANYSHWLYLNIRCFHTDNTPNWTYSSRVRSCCTHTGDNQLLAFEIICIELSRVDQTVARASRFSDLHVTENQRFPKDRPPWSWQSNEELHCGSANLKSAIATVEVNILLNLHRLTPCLTFHKGIRAPKRHLEPEIQCRRFY